MIFVFGSNLSGIHGAGAALYAHKNYGAEWGVGRGRTGNSYALPTKGVNICNIPFEQVQGYIQEFCDHARENPSETFLLTPVGCGLAGFDKKDVWAAFKEFGLPSNVVLTSTWITD